jgi:hypothetical protein
VRLSKALGEVKKNIFDIIFGVGYEKLKLKYGLKF